MNDFIQFYSDEIKIFRNKYLSLTSMRGRNFESTFSDRYHTMVMSDPLLVFLDIVPLNLNKFRRATTIIHI